LLFASEGQIVSNGSCNSGNTFRVNDVTSQTFCLECFHQVDIVYFSIRPTSGIFNNIIPVYDTLLLQKSGKTKGKCKIVNSEVKQD